MFILLKQAEPQNVKKGFDLITKAAEGGVVDAQIEMVQFYHVYARYAKGDLATEHTQKAEYWAERGCKSESELTCYLKTAIQSKQANQTSTQGTEQPNIDG